ncbi:MAG TPA: M42 family metallopeptidase [Eubacteriaceae bacterium]|nr:M42 family metallopeptidase [Eubacteriaceae bacterium]
MNNEKALLLRELLNAFGPSGNEENISMLIEDNIKAYVDNLYRDVMGNLIAYKKGIGKKIMISAHMDEIGLIITHIDQEGYLRFSNIGGVSADLIQGQRVVFKNGIIGVIFSESLDKDEKVSMGNLFIDIGVNNKEDAAKIVSIGDVGTLYGPLVINNHRGFSKAMDNRIGCYILIEVLKRINKYKNELYFVFTVQEELGKRGAQISTYSINPDMGIVVDVTKTGDTPKGKTMAISLGKGPGIKVFDSSIITHPKVKELLTTVAEESNIPYQLEVLEEGGTDAGAIYLTRGGIPTGVLSIPTRYIHSSGEMVDLNDVENAIRLLLKVLEEEII